jgi:hypothetical protein
MPHTYRQLTAKGVGFFVDSIFIGLDGLPLKVADLDLTYLFSIPAWPKALHGK